MTALIRDELAYWKRRKAEGTLAEPASEEERGRETILRMALRAIEERHYRPACEVVRELRDFWTSVPQLNRDAANRNGVDRSCDDALAALE